MITRTGVPTRSGLPASHMASMKNTITVHAVFGKSRAGGTRLGNISGGRNPAKLPACGDRVT